MNENMEENFTACDNLYCAIPSINTLYIYIKRKAMKERTAPEEWRGDDKKKRLWGY